MLQNSENLYYDLIDLPGLGPAYVFWSGELILGLFFKVNGGEELRDFKKEMQKYYKNKILSSADGAFLLEKIISRTIKASFVGSPLELKVWAVLEQIPLGQTRTYTEVAEVAGFPKAVRAVASAIGRNPLSMIIPCHRVVRKGGGLGGYRFGLELKKQILRREGVIMGSF